GNVLHLFSLQIVHWTEGAKWSSNKTIARHFTKIYQCMAIIDWELISGETRDRNMSPARTLLYMRDGALPRSSSLRGVSDIYLQLISRYSFTANHWPDAVNLIVIGTDKQSMMLRDFLDYNNNSIGARLSVHFVHRPRNIVSSVNVHFL
ncbi:hypothetical protein PFISCL1PPCAC_11105, partial [Pristionchus fissidentatus]